MSKIMEELATLARLRPIDLQTLKEKGAKIVEYTGSFVPEELIIAAGAEPYLLCRGGQPEPPDAVLPYMLRFMNPHARSQVGFYLLALDPLTPIADLIVAQQTDCHAARISELMEYLKLPVFKVGVPSDWEKPHARDYYYRALEKLKVRLEKLTGNEITDAKLKESILRINRINQGLRKIAELRKSPSPPFGGYNFIKLNHYSYFCKPELTCDKLDILYNAMKESHGAFLDNAPRILLVGHVVAFGDYVVPKLIEDLGAVIVAEMLDEGIRPYHLDVVAEGDLLKNIGEKLFVNRIPPSVFQPSWEYRFEKMKEIIEEYRIEGVVWYQLAFDEIYDMECSCILKWMDELNMPFLKLESSYEYSREAMGPLTTRIESFVESIKARRK